VKKRDDAATGKVLERDQTGVRTAKRVARGPVRVKSMDIGWS
jgi:hypothetical protein